MIIEKNTNKHDLQYATPELRKRDQRTLRLSNYAHFYETFSS